MSGQLTPSAETPDWHPVHRANALLQAALLSSAHAEPIQDRYSVESLSHEIASVLCGPVSITYPVPLKVRLDALAAKQDAYVAFEDLAGADEFEEEQLTEPELLSTDECCDLDDGPDLTAGVPLDPERRMVAPQVHVQSLLYEFQRRQRQASLLVAGSIATAVVLTLGGVMLIASWAAPQPADQRPANSTSVVWYPGGRLSHRGLCA